jgi:acetyl esterase/lipase
MGTISAQMQNSWLKLGRSPTTFMKVLLMSIALVSVALLLSSGGTPPGVLLWPNGAPSAVGNRKADKPTLSAFLPAVGEGNGTAVIICPGGSYKRLVADVEGDEPAQWLQRRGVAAFVLRYRLAPRYNHPAPMLDLQRAIRMVRARAKEWKVDPTKIGVWGFSAGGHLAATACTHSDLGNPVATDEIDRASCRPDFAILCYPVITFLGTCVQTGTRDALLGTKPDEKLLEDLSAEKQVTARTPPTFLFHTDNDVAVLPENSIVYYSALRQAHVPAELHIYANGPHGVGLATDDPVLSTWTARLEDWMRGQSLLTK